MFHTAVCAHLDSTPLSSNSLTQALGIVYQDRTMLIRLQPTEATAFQDLMIFPFHDVFNKTARLQQGLDVISLR